jgi:hypothetical protein
MPQVLGRYVLGRDMLASSLLVFIDHASVAVSVPRWLPMSQCDSIFFDRFLIDEKASEASMHVPELYLHFRRVGLLTLVGDTLMALISILLV